MGLREKTGRSLKYANWLNPRKQLLDLLLLLLLLVLLLLLLLLLLLVLLLLLLLLGYYFWLLLNQPSFPGLTTRWAVGLKQYLHVFEVLGRPFVFWPNGWMD